jgi:excisionase family DNA binding protein
MRRTREVTRLAAERATDAGDAPEYLTSKQAAAYLHLNEKKLYELAASGEVPATKATGKWLFPKRLLDEWLLESAHGGAMTDRLVVGGSDDPLLAAAIASLAADLAGEALVAYSPTGTRLGLELLSRRRTNVAAIHWGPLESSRTVHAQLVAAYRGSRDWAIVRMANREQGVILRPGFPEAGSLSALATRRTRWAMRQTGAGSQHFLESALREVGLDADRLDVTATALSERHAAALVARGEADCAPGAASAAAEFGLAFLPLGWEAFDLVVPRAVFFRSLFHRLLDTLRGERLRPLAAALAGYDLSDLGRVVAGPEGTLPGTA